MKQRYIQIRKMHQNTGCSYTIFWILIVAVLALLCTGCGGSGQTEQANKKTPNTAVSYSVEWLSLTPEPSTEAGIFMMPIVAAGKVYYVNRDMEMRTDTLYWQDIESGERGSRELKLAEQYTLTDFAVDGEGNCYYCIHDSSLRLEDPNARVAKLLIKQDEAGTELYRIKIPEEHGGVMPSINVDVQGNIYFAGSEEYVVYNSNGEYAEIIPWQPWEELAAAAAGEEYVPHGIVWENYDILTETVKSVTACEDGRWYAVVSDYEEKCYEIAIFTPLGKGQLSNGEESANAEFSGTEDSEKEIILGVLTTNANVRAAVVDYNKAQSEVRVLIKEYRPEGSSLTIDEAIASMYQDAQTGNGADILAISPGMDWKKLADAALLEDLYPYVEQSRVIQENDYVQGAWGMHQWEDKLLAIPTDFTIQTVVCKKEHVEEATFLSMAKLVSLAENNPGSELLEHTTRKSILNLCFAYRADAYVNREEGTCNFQTEDFYKIMEFVKQFPKETDVSVITDEDRFVTDKVLLQEVELINGESCLQVYEDFGMEEVAFVGYPATEAGNGYSINPCGEVFGISALSVHKDAAWKFIETYDSWNQEQMRTVGFSAKKAVLAKQIEGALEGNPILLLADMPNRSEDWDAAIANILQEESIAFLEGHKSVEEVAAIIQNRASIYLAEQK